MPFNIRYLIDLFLFKNKIIQLLKSIKNLQTQKMIQIIVSSLNHFLIHNLYLYFKLFFKKTDSPNISNKVQDPLKLKSEKQTQKSPFPPFFLTITHQYPNLHPPNPRFYKSKPSPFKIPSNLI